MNKPRGPVGAGQRAATPRGYPYPLRSWPPDAAIDIQLLAEAVSNDVVKTGAVMQATGAYGSTPANLTQVAWNLTTVDVNSGGYFSLTGGGISPNTTGSCRITTKFLWTLTSDSIQFTTSQVFPALNAGKILRPMAKRINADNRFMHWIEVSAPATPILINDVFAGPTLGYSANVINVSCTMTVEPIR